MNLLSSSFLALACCCAAPSWAEEFKTAAAINDFLRTSAGARAGYRIKGQIVDIGKVENRPLLTVDDGTASIEIHPEEFPSAYVGNIIECLGYAGTTLTGVHYERAIVATNITTIGRRPVRCQTVRLANLDDRQHDLRRISTSGLICDTFPDEIDTNTIFVLLKDGAKTLPVAQDKSSRPFVEIGTRVQVSGIYHRTVSGDRKFSGPYLVEREMRILQRPPTDPFAVPDLANEIYLTPTEVAQMDRRKVCGRVLAAWGGNRLLLQANDGRIINATLASHIALPNCGLQVVLAGWPETDLFRINLAKAIWKAVDPSDAGAAQPIDKITREGTSLPKLSSALHGNLIRLTGIVRSIPSSESPEQRLYITCDNATLPVESGAHMSLPPGLVIGCKVAVTGRCFLETGTWSRFNVFPHMRSATLILRTPDDIVILSRPSWWTSAKLLGVITILVLIVIAILAWNRMLRKLVERRGRELYRAEIDRASSELRVGERTRLAVELHDSLSQNLTGIALAINAGEYEIAKKSLKSCREELKNCLWDLRNNALEEADINVAIRKTLAPHIATAHLTVRFSLARKQLTDKTTHTILRILRELAVNAIRHGNATQIRIAGSVEEHRVLFSMRDNGGGFDPTTAPGMEEGHFGLQGIRERVESLGGDMEIVSAPSKGTKITIWLKSKC